VARFEGATIDLEPSEQVLEVVERNLKAAPARTRKVALRVLRRSLRSGKSEASRELRREIPLPKKKIDSRISIDVLSTSRIVGSLKVRRARFELIDYMTEAQIRSQWKRQQVRNRRRATTPLKIKVYKSEGRKAFADHFVNKGRRSGRWHVFSRSDPPDRDSHRIRYGPPITEKLDPKLERFARAQVNKFQAELLRILRDRVEIV